MCRAMGELLLELKPLAVVMAVVSIVWLTAMSDVQPRRVLEPAPEVSQFERFVDVGDEYEPWDERWGLVNVEMEAE